MRILSCPNTLKAVTLEHRFVGPLQRRWFLEENRFGHEVLLDMSDEGPGGWHHPAVSSEADGPMVSE